MVTHFLTILRVGKVKVNIRTFHSWLLNTVKTFCSLVTHSRCLSLPFLNSVGETTMLFHDKGSWEREKGEMLMRRNMHREQTRKEGEEELTTHISTPKDKNSCVRQDENMIKTSDPPRCLFHLFLWQKEKFQRECNGIEEIECRMERETKRQPCVVQELWMTNRNLYRSNLSARLSDAIFQRSMWQGGIGVRKRNLLTSWSKEYKRHPKQGMTWREK